MSRSAIAYRLASLTDFVAVSALLTASKLPASDIASHITNFIVAHDNGNLVGCIGLEIYGEHALLRSLAVSEKYRNRSVGIDLVNRIIHSAKQSDIQEIHLLTETAETYFLRRGFVVAVRSAAPDAIAGTTEFSHLCPSNAAYMTKKI